MAYPAKAIQFPTVLRSAWIIIVFLALDLAPIARAGDPPQSTSDHTGPSDLRQCAYSAGHNLQEPIRNVAVYSELISKRYHSVLDGQQFLGFLREGGRRLATLVSDLLAYTRASMAELSPTLVDSSALLDSTLANLAESIWETNATVTSNGLPEVYMGERHLQQVFQNLIGNALKYRNEDAPRALVSAAGRGAFWCFSVQDNGIGIDPEYKEKIFGAFKRLHHGDKYGGTGIGLAICQRVVERYGGRIWVESEPGREQLSTSPSPGARPKSVPNRLNLLLAEDNLPDALLVREIIRSENLPLDVHIAADGERAIDFIENATKDANAPAPDLLLLDINLPKRDGFKVLRRLRAIERFKSVPVLVINSSDAPRDLSEAAKLGAGYFRKPPSYDEFLKLGGVLRKILKESGVL